MNIVYSEQFEKTLLHWKRKDQRIFEQIGGQIEKIVQQPEVGKPLRYTLKNRRRVHVGSFVLIYEFHNNQLRFLDFDRHDRIYKQAV